MSTATGADADNYIDDILNAPTEEILSEFEEKHGGVEHHVTELRAIIEGAIAEANKRRDALIWAGQQAQEK